MLSKKGKDEIKNEKMVGEKQDLGVIGAKLHPNTTYITQVSLFKSNTYVYSCPESVELYRQQ